MPKFRVEQYETHVAYYEVESDDLVNAIKEVMNGGGNMIHTEFIDVDMDRGMPTAELSKDESIRLGLYIDDDFVHSIRSVKEIE
jgi:hypothetical protein